MFLLKKLRQICAAQMFLYVHLSVDYGQFIRGYTFRENGLFLSWQSVATSNLFGAGIICTIPLFMLRFGLALGLVHTVTTTQNYVFTLLCPEDTASL